MHVKRDAAEEWGVRGALRGREGGVLTLAAASLWLAGGGSAKTGSGSGMRVASEGACGCAAAGAMADRGSVASVYRPAV